MTDTRKAQLAAELDASGVRKGAAEVKGVVRDMAADVGRSAGEAGKQVDKIGDGAAAAAGKVDRGTRSIIASIERTTAAAQAGSRGTAEYFEAIAKQRGANVDALKPYLDQLRAAQQGQAQAAAGLDRMGTSAKQTAAALRQVPAQFTDIVTSLASGQQPLTVLLQQGGQLKDAFGGAGNAARALGGYVAGLISPFTLLAAAGAAAALAFELGARESSAYQRALILSGQAIGVTADQLQRMAEAVRASGAGTQRAASEVLATMAKEAKVGADNLERFTAAALAMQAAGGPAAAETAKAFADLGREPLAAAIKLNEATGFLTRSTYEQIKALDDQGRSAEAARVAQEAYAAAIEQRAPQMVQTLGTVERAWAAIKRAGAAAIDSVLDIGRGDTLRQQIEATAKRLESARTGIYSRDKVPELEQQLASLREQERLERRTAEATAARAAALRAGIEYDKEAEKYRTKAEAQAREIAKIEALGLAAGKGRVEIEAQIARVREKYAETVRRTARDTSDPFAADRSAAQAWAQFYERITGQIARARGELDGLTDGQRMLVDYLQSPAYQQMAEPVRQAALQQAYLLISLEQRAKAEQDAARAAKEAEREREQAYQASLRAYDQWLDSLDRGADAVQRQVRAARDEAEAAEIAATGRLTLKQAIEQVTIARLQEQQAMLSLAGEDDAAAAVQREIDARRELQTLIGRADARKAAADAAKDAADEWRKASSEIERTITDALMRSFESGKGFAASLRDTLENTFKTMVLRPIVQAAVQPVAGAVNSALGLGNTANGINSLANLAGLSSGAGFLANATYGAAIGTTSIGAGSQAAMLASQTAAFGAEGAALTAAAAGNAGTASIMSGLGAAAPYLGAALAIYAIAKMLDDSGTPHTGGSSLYSAAMGLSTGMGVSGVGSRAGDYSTQVESLTSGIARTVVGILDTTATTFGKAAGFAAAAGFADDASKDGAWGALLIEQMGRAVIDWGTNPASANAPRIFSDGEAGSKQYIAAVAADVRRALDGIGLPVWAQQMLDSLGDAPTLDQLGAVVDTINATQRALLQLGAAMPQLANLSGTAVQGLLALFGNADNLASAAGSYFANFYTEAERAQYATQQMAEALGKVGLSVPASRDAYRQLVEAQDLNTEAGRKAYAVLLQLAPSFAELVPAVQAVGDAIDQTAAQAAEAAARMAEAGRAALADLASQGAALRVDLLRAQGDTAGANAAQRAIDLQRITAGLSDADRAAAEAAYDLNTALQQQIDATRAAATAAEQAAAAQQQAGAEAQRAAEAAAAAEAQRLQAIAAERTGLEDRLLQLQGDTAELRRRELGALDASNRALLEQIYALQDQQTAADAAAEAAREAAAASEAAAQAERERTAEIDALFRRLTDQRADLQIQMAEARGDTAEAKRLTRARDLAELTEGMTSAEAERAAAMYDANAALQAQIDAVREARAAWQALADSITREADRIRGTMANGGGTLAAAQAQFAMATAQARAGDRAAAEALPGLSQSMLSLAEQQAGSLLDLQRLRAQTAASLDTTAAALQGRADPAIGVDVPASATGPQAMADELRKAREDQRAQAEAMASLTLKISKILSRWDDLIEASEPGTPFVVYSGAST